MLTFRTFACSVLLAAPALASALTLPPGTPRFKLESVSVAPGAIWKLNREIVFQFNDDLDLSSVNPNTLQLTDDQGSPILGEFHLRATDELVFQPACPTQVDFSDGGLMPNRTYLLKVPAGMASGVLLSLSGDALFEGADLSFTTPNSVVLPDLFDDGAFGPAEILVAPSSSAGSYLETGTGLRTYFQHISLGHSGTPNYQSPLNLHSDPDSRLTVHVALNQPLANFPWNINSNNARLEYRQPNGPWHPLPTKVELIQNCGGGPASLALTADGVLPQDRIVRVFISENLLDLVGESLVSADTSLRFRTQFFEDAQGNAVDHIDEWREEFNQGATASDSLEDDQATLEYPTATWDAGQLSAVNQFQGTGGPNGTFDFHVPANTDMVFSTIQQSITGGPNGIPTHSVLVINGVLDIRDLYVPASSTLRFQGPNGVKILASGTVEIDGLVRLNGRNAKSVFTINNPTVPEIGALGNCGGGRGGVGSYLTTAVTPFGGSGFGAFDISNQGGQGGESGWSVTTAPNGEHRRAAGGGGGRFGADQTVLWGDSICADESSNGLNTESGFPGADQANSALGAHLPYGGHGGPTAFNRTASLRDDFFGRAQLDFQSPNAQLVDGELPHAWAGSGGGAGGDGTRVLSGDTYPPAAFINSHQDKGAGGGGGAGSIEIYALGDVAFGPVGRLTAIGGHGNGGENTAGTNRVGGGSGGGSGGHIIIHTAGRLDLSQVPAGSFALDAKGGQGGDGANGLGGAFIGESTPSEDARHVGINNGVDNPWEFLDFQCQRYWQALFAPQSPKHVIRAAGGDGGPGVIQLHVGKLSGFDSTHDIAYPGAGLQSNLGSVIRPVPIGYDAHQGEWRDHLLPDLGTRFQSQSRWISLGQPQVTPGSNTPDLLEFLFNGTDPATGIVSTTNGLVDLLAPMLAPSNLPESPGLPTLVGGDGIYFDPSGLPPIYRDNPSLLVGFAVERAGHLRPVESATYRQLGSQQVLALSLGGHWPVPPVGGPVTLRPRHFRVAGGSASTTLANEVPAGMSIKFEFQAAGALSDGSVDPSAVFPANDLWATDPSVLTNAPDNRDFRYLRFRVTMDVAGQAPGLLSSGALSVDLLKLPFQF